MSSQKGRKIQSMGKVNTGGQRGSTEGDPMEIGLMQGSCMPAGS